MINTDYGNLYGQYVNARYNDKTKAANTKNTEQSKSRDAQSAGKKTDDITQEDFQKLYAKLNGINYGEYDEKDAYRSMANTFLNEMVFSPMSSSKELFIPQMSRSFLSAAFNAAYDSSSEIERIKENYNFDDIDNDEDVGERQ